MTNPMTNYEACNYASQTFCWILEQNGQLADIKDKSEIPGLPKKITYVRYPDGHVEKVPLTKP